MLGGFAALHYWFPKLTGRLMGEGLGKDRVGRRSSSASTSTRWPMFLAGLKGQPVDIYKFFSGIGVDGYNPVASIGAFVLAIGILLELGNAADSYRNGVRAGHDPWGGATLEWFALSPPPPHNFDVVPDVRSASPCTTSARRSRDRTEIWPRHAETRHEPVPVTVGAPAAPDPPHSEPSPEATEEASTQPADAGREEDATPGEGDAEDGPSVS